MKRLTSVICFMAALLISGSAFASWAEDFLFTKYMEEMTSEEKSIYLLFLQAGRSLQSNSKANCVSECQTVYSAAHCEQKCSAAEQEVKNEFEKRRADFVDMNNRRLLKKYEAGAFPFVRDKYYVRYPTAHSAFEAAAKNVKKNDGTFCRSECGHVYPVDHCEGVCSSVERTLKSEMEERRVEWERLKKDENFEKYK